MQIRCYRFQKNGSLQLTEETPNSLWLHDEVFRWLDIDYPENIQELREVLAPLNLDEALLEEVESPENGVKVESFQHAFFFQLPQPANGDFTYPYTPVICVGQTVISLNREVPVTPEQVTERLRRLGLEESTNLPNFLLYIFWAIMKVDIQFYQQTRAATDELARGFDQGFNAQVLDNIRKLTNQIGRLQATTEDRIILANAFLSQSTQWMGMGDLRKIFKETLGVLKQLKRWLEHLEKRLNGISQHFELSLQTNTDTRLRILTVISAIFLPLTLIAGIYGMNFQNMPELDEPNAYYLVLTLMVLLGGGMATWFYLRGWFR